MVDESETLRHASITWRMKKHRKTQARAMNMSDKTICKTAKRGGFGRVGVGVVKTRGKLSKYM